MRVLSSQLRRGPWPRETRGGPGATPPPPLEPSGVPPVPYVKYWYGNDVLWVMLPQKGVLPTQCDPSSGRLVTKYPWWRIQPGALQVTAERLDGLTKEFSASTGDVEAYGALLRWPKPGRGGPARLGRCQITRASSANASVRRRADEHRSRDRRSPCGGSERRHGRRR